MAQAVPFTQYLRPDGRKVSVSIERPENIATKAQSIIDRGLRFECEQLIDGSISLTISDDNGDIDIEVVPNGPEVPPAVDRLVLRNAV